MLNTFPIALIAGALLGFLAGLGVGGGSLLILWLTVVLHTPHPIARAINLLFFIPTALISCWFRVRQGTLELRKVLPGILLGMLSAAIFSVVSRSLDVKLLQKLFGILLLLTGLRELLYRPRKAR